VEDYLFMCYIVMRLFQVIYHLHQNSVNFGQDVIGETILSGPTVELNAAS